MLGHLKRLAEYRDLLFTMTVRDIQVRYKQTLLGIAWAVAQPLAFMVVLTVLKSSILKESTSEGTPHQVFLYCAMVPWMFFQSSLTAATTSVSGNMGLVSKIYFPREIFPAAAIFACVVDFLIAATIFGGMMAFYHIPFTAGLLWIPILFGIELMFVLGMGFFLAAANVFYRDVKYIVPLALQLLLFASPVIYSIRQVPKQLRGWYALNPMTVVIDGFRQAILHGAAPNYQQLAMSFGVAALCCTLAYWYFKRSEGKFADLI